ncbi:alginate export family protein [Formosa undariae]|uniref:Alginate export family protein n=1 Tax=Formosa undariae TaxID=1325436 RepID=A0ABV5F4I7_9FLAO
MTKITLLTVLLLMVSGSCFAQFSIDGELRPRTEFRHGYGTLIADDADPGFGISTRARVNLGYKKETYEIYIGVQDVFVWGENRQLLIEDANNSLSLFQAWAKLKLNENWSTKLGRQVIAYDDQRILGGVDWTQQGRNHDAVLIQLGKESLKFDAGFAYNQDYNNPSGFQNTDNTYYTTGYFSYKTMQYGYVKNTWDAFSASFLFMNNGFQEFDDNNKADGLSNLQTFGTHLVYKKANYDVASNIYLQTGNRQGDIKVNTGLLASIDAHYKVTSKVKLGAGFEYISGKSQDESADETGAFFPLYGTNHKFNGYMDYFYVGNHANSIGLVDIHMNADFTLGEKSVLGVSILNFSGAEELSSGEKSLGTEIDLVFQHKFNEFSVAAGYSQMFASDGMYELKGVTEDLAANSQNWVWAMLILKPKFL